MSPAISSDLIPRLLSFLPSVVRGGNGRLEGEAEVKITVKIERRINIMTSAEGYISVEFPLSVELPARGLCA